MRIFTGRTILAALTGVFLCYGPAPASAQTILDRDLIEVLAGIQRVLQQADNAHEDRQNLDGSIRWEYIEKEDKNLLEISFRGFRYYIVKEEAADSRVITLSGAMNLDFDEEHISGSLTVQGLPSVSSLVLTEYNPKTGLVTVNGSPYDNGVMEGLFDEAYELIDDNALVDMEIEAGIVFVTMFIAVTEINLEKKLNEADFDGVNIPGGIEGSNEKGTVNFSTRKGVVDISYAAYTRTDIPFYGSFPVLDGKISMEFRIDQGDADFVAVFDGSLAVKNMLLVSSMRLDACMMEDIGEKNASGSIVIDGESYQFSDFAGTLKRLSF
ncbi:MAG: hypothetical protein LBK27_03720 [Treponema sp.]|jgi:hypothetical protein|nr:hypothetical protein [Treponema sp.]